MAHESRSHAILSASSSHRWLNCPPSAKLNAERSDTVSEYAKEGTCAHELAEYKLRKALGQSEKELHEITENLDFFDSEMDECTDSYADFVLEQLENSRKICPDTLILIEQRLDFSEYVPDGFGTGDCLIVADGTLQVIDFKYGLGVLVSAEKNSQMMLYALGSLAIYRDLYDIEKVRMTIFQPRRENVSDWEISVSELLDWTKNSHLYILHN